MPQRLVIGNWKLHLTAAEAVALADGVAKGLGGLDWDPSRVGVGVAPSFPLLVPVAQALGGEDAGLVHVEVARDGGLLRPAIAAAAREKRKAEGKHMGEGERQRTGRARGRE